MSINMIDRIFCINLDKRTDRWESVKKEFEREGLSVERISAVDGESLSDCDITRYQAGCLQSHLNAVRIAREANCQSVMIFEDDIILCDNFLEKLIGFLKEVPQDWDMLYLSGHFHGIPGHHIKISDNVHKLYGIFGLIAYIIRNTVYNKAITHLEQMQIPADNYYCERIVPEINAYVRIPFLAGTQTGYSNISNVHCPSWDAVNDWFEK